MSKNNKLTDKFLLELFKLTLMDKKILETVISHLNYSYIPVEFGSYKKVLKSLSTIYKVTEKMPTYGAISQQHNTDIQVQELLEEIKESDIADSELILTHLEDYIKSMRFQILNDRIFDLYNEGKKEEAITLSAKESTDIANFSLRNVTGDYLRVFADFQSQQNERAESKEHEISEKVPFGIDTIDDITNGGIDVTDTVLWIMRSGVGKSTTLKWTGLYAARLGYDVLHFQLEGSKKEAFDKYTQAWTALDYNTVRNGNLSPEQMKKMSEIASKMSKSSKDIDIYSFEKFGEASMIDIYDRTVEYQRIHNKFPDLIIIDSLDLIHPGDGIKYGIDTQSVKMKLKKSAQAMKNMSLEFKSRVLTATQSGSVSQEFVNDPDKYLTRDNTEGDRTLIQSFSYVLTFNQTEDEKRKKEGRIYVDKLRNYPSPKKLYPICTAYEFGKFYDRKRTLQKFLKDE